ncbi:MAG: AzlD domain-containing protein [Atopobiaceae bacterium]
MNMWIYVLAMGAATVSLRVLPVVFIRRPLESPYLKSFLYYVPYVTLAVMTVPAIFESTQSPLAGAAALALGIYASWRGKSLFVVAAVCCATVLVLELFLA